MRSQQIDARELLGSTVSLPLRRLFWLKWILEELAVSMVRDDCFFLGGDADEEVFSVAAGRPAVGLSDSPLVSVSSWVLAPDDFFLFFSSDVLSLDF